MIDENDYKKLEAEVRRLRADIDGLKAFVRHESDDVTKHILRIHQSLVDAWNLIWPMVDKILPDVARDKRRINDITRSKKT